MRFSSLPQAIFHAQRSSRYISQDMAIWRVDARELPDAEYPVFIVRPSNDRAPRGGIFIDAYRKGWPLRPRNK